MGAGGFGTISVGDLQRDFASNSAAFNTQNTSGIVNVSPDSPAGKAILDSLGDGQPGFLRFRGQSPMGGIPSGVASPAAASSAASLPTSWLIVAAIVLLFLLFS